MSLVFISSAVVSAMLVFFVLKHAQRQGIFDLPNARSSHTVATPRGGGLGLVLAFLSVVGLYIGPALGVAGAGAAAAVAMVAAIGWMDDHGDVSVRARLLVHVCAGALLLPLVRELPLSTMAVQIGAAWWVFWMVSAVNVVNFMDGIDGIIGLQSMVFGVFVACLGEPAGPAAVAGLALAGVSFGFLWWNWSPARIFMGDVGSGALGAIFVVLGAILVREGRVHFVAAFAPLAPIFFDAAVTLAARIRRRERISEAHRSHLYQRLANSGLGHSRVAALFGIWSIGCAVVAAVLPRGGAPLLAVLIGICATFWISLDRLLRRRLSIKSPS